MTNFLVMFGFMLVQTQKRHNRHKKQEAEEKNKNRMATQGYEDPYGEQAYDTNGGYYDEYGGYYDANGGYTDANGVYYEPQQTQVDENGGYYDVHGGYTDANGGYTDINGVYYEPQQPQVDEYGGYYDANGGYTDANGVYYPAEGSVVMHETIVTHGEFDRNNNIGLDTYTPAEGESGPDLYYNEQSAYYRNTPLPKEDNGRVVYGTGKQRLPQGGTGLRSKNGPQVRVASSVLSFLNTSSDIIDRPPDPEKLLKYVPSPSPSHLFFFLIMFPFVQMFSR